MYVDLRLGLAINKIYSKAKKKTMLSKTLDWFFCFEDDQNYETQTKNQEKNW
jgi:hypothetical protein